MKQITLDLEDELYQVLQDNANKLEITTNEYILKQLIEILEEKKIHDLETLNKPSDIHVG